ncbi:MAG: hypothetical protein ACI9G1_002672 [Pirellulaceae bacterium]
MFVVSFLALAVPFATYAQPPQRTGKGLIALYEFREKSGSAVKDTSGLGSALDLRIENLDATTRTDGALQIHTATTIKTDGPATKIVEALRQSGEISVEAWVQSAKIDQEGPARLVTISSNTSNRNFTLGQDVDKVDARLRSSGTTNNGMPSTASKSKSFDTKLHHLLYTRSSDGKTRLYIDGKLASTGRADGHFQKWDAAYRLAFANELSNDRPWLGTLHLVAFFNRDLNAAEVERHFLAGPNASSPAAELIEGPVPPSLLTVDMKATSGRLFDRHVASILAKNCLECHNAKTRKGRLDLSRKATAFAGGSGNVIMPGDPDNSLVWTSIESDEMPQKRRSLSPSEKRYIQQWIRNGAVFSQDSIARLAVDESQIHSTWIQRLTVTEYIETVRSAVGVDIEIEARDLLPSDLRADGFSNTAYNLSVDLGHIEAYAKLARIIAAKLDVPKFVANFSSSDAMTDDHLRQVISSMGKRLFRGPLGQQEVEPFISVFRAVVKEGGDYRDVIRFVLEGMLQSPRFIYRIENQQGDGELNDYELANRMSYILWGAPPDAELMRAADNGELNKQDNIALQTKRMLTDSRAIDRSAQFIAEWFDLDRLQYLRPNRKKFPNWDPALAEDMRSETIMFFKDIVWKQRRPLSELLNAQFTYVTPRLAKHYNLNSALTGDGIQRLETAAVPERGGLLTHGSLLTVGGDEASMVSRGLFVLHDLLRGKVADPPPCVNTTPVPTEPGLTQRGIALERVANNSCGGCHSKFEPLAFGLEKFDGLGSYLEKDHHGNELRDDGTVVIPGVAEPIPYANSAQLMNILAGSDRVRECMTWKVVQFAIGRPLTASDEPELAKIHQAATKLGGTYQDLIAVIVASELVQKGSSDKAKPN